MSEIQPSVVYRTGRPTAADYDEAIEALMEARSQLEPDGDSCHVCTDSGHQAWECHHNPLVMAREAATMRHQWRCFHCGDVFTDETAARNHFGKDPDVVAACKRDELCLSCLGTGFKREPLGPWTGGVDSQFILTAVDPSAASMKPLFIPLNAEFYDKFKSGEKTEELRAYGPRWNERTCPVGRPVAISRGYGKSQRLAGKIWKFKKQRGDTFGSTYQASILKIYGTLNVDIAVISITLEAAQ